MSQEPKKIDITPEETWPEASLLLDRHFARKRRKKRLLIFFLLAGIIGVETWWIFSPTELNETPVVMSVTPKRKEESSRSGLPVKNDQSRRSLSTEAQKLAVKPKTVDSSISAEPKASSNESPTVRTTSTVAAMPKQRVNAATEAVALTNLPSSAAVPSTISHMSPESSVSATSKDEVATTTSKENTLASGSASDSSRLPEQQSATAVSSRFDSSADSLTSTQVSLTVTLESMATDTSSSRPSHDTLSLGAPISALNSSDSAAHDMKPLPSVSSVQPDSLSRTVSWSLEIYGGAVHSEKFLAAKDNSWVDRREQEEKAVMVPVVGLSVSLLKSHWIAGFGIESVQWGENTSYSPSTYQQIITDESYWTYRVDSTDTAYISGNQYFQPDPSPTFYDSTLSPVFDTTYGFAVDPQLSADNGHVRWRYLEFPVSLGYAFSAGRWRWTLTGALSPSLLITTSGKYLAQDQSGAVPVVEIASTRTMGLSTRLGLDFGYALNRRWQLSLCPQWRRQWFSSFTDSSAVDQRYRGLGVTAGIRYHLFH